MNSSPISRTFCGAVTFAVMSAVSPHALAITVGGEAIAEVAVTWVDSVARSNGLNSIEVKATSIPSSREISDPGASLVALATSSIDQAGVHMIPVHAIHSDGERRTLATVGVKITRFGLVPKAKHPMNRGDVIEEADVDWRRSALPRTLETPVPSPVGSRLRRGARAGDILVSRMLESVPTIARGDRVEITSERGAIRVTFTGHAVEDGRVGDAFRVADSRNHKTIRARVTGPGRAILEP